MSGGFTFTDVMAVLELDRFGGGGSILVWAAIAHGLRTNLVVIEGNLNVQHYRDKILKTHVIPPFQNNGVHEVPSSIPVSGGQLWNFFIGPHIRREYRCSFQEAESRKISISCKSLFLKRCKLNMLKNNANITLFQRDNTTSHTARDTVNFLRANYTEFINDWPAKNPDLNPSEHLWDKLDQRVRRFLVPPSNVIQIIQALMQEWNNILRAEINTLIHSMGQRCQTVLHADGGHIRY